MRLIPQYARACARAALTTIFGVIATATTVAAQTVAIDQVPPIALTTSQSASAVTVDPATGNVTVLTSAGNYNSCTNVVTPPPAITTFYPSSTQVNTGALITLNWASSNATSCSPQQGTGTTWASLGTLPPNGSQTVTAPTTAGTVTFQLTCSNGARSDVKTTQVTVQSGGGGATCTQTYPNTTVTEFSTYFGTWPAFGHSIRISVPYNGAISWRFTASASTTQFGSVATVGFPGDGDGFGQISISRSPGCFNPSELGPNCIGPVSREMSTGWANFPNQFSCQLTPGQVYYANITYGGAQSGTGGPYCPNGINCQADVQNQVQQ